MNQEEKKNIYIYIYLSVNSGEQIIISQPCSIKV